MRKIITRHKIEDTVLILSGKNNKYFATLDGKDIYTDSSRQSVADYYFQCLEYLRVIAQVPLIKE